MVHLNVPFHSQLYCLTLISNTPSRCVFDFLTDIDNKTQEYQRIYCTSGGDGGHYFIQAEATNTTSSVPSSTTPGPNSSVSASSPSSMTTQSENRNNHVGAIVGGVLGGIAIICLTVAVTAFLTRRWLRKVKKPEPNSSGAITVEPSELDGHARHAPKELENPPAELSGMRDAHILPIEMPTESKISVNLRR
jgi:hypothetical protein